MRRAISQINDPEAYARCPCGLLPIVGPRLDSLCKPPAVRERYVGATRAGDDLAGSSITPMTRIGPLL